MAVRISYSSGRITLEAFFGGCERTCYLVLPGGLSDEISSWAQNAVSEHSLNLVLVLGTDWNDDLTPWPAPGVFRKAKPFGGKASAFLETLVNEHIPTLEKELFHGSDASLRTRTLAGVSLSGLFAIWAAHQTDAFDSVISISGSLWYDGFAAWTAGSRLSPSVRSVYLSLGDREKNSRDQRMRTVEDCTRAVASCLSGNETSPKVMLSIEKDTTHFSPVVPRLESAFACLEEMSV